MVHRTFKEWLRNQECTNKLGEKFRSGPDTSHVCPVGEEDKLGTVMIEQLRTRVFGLQSRNIPRVEITCLTGQINVILSLVSGKGTVFEMLGKVPLGEKFIPTGVRIYASEIVQS